MLPSRCRPLQSSTEETFISHRCSQSTHELSLLLLLQGPAGVYEVVMPLSVNGTLIHTIRTKNNAEGVMGQVPWDYTRVELHCNAPPHSSFPFFFFSKQIIESGGRWWRVQRGLFQGSCHIWGGRVEPVWEHTHHQQVNCEYSEVKQRETTNTLLQLLVKKMSKYNKMWEASSLVQSGTKFMHLPQKWFSRFLGRWLLGEKLHSVSVDQSALF